MKSGSQQWTTKNGQWDIVKIIFHWVKERFSFNFFYSKKNEEVKLDLQNFEIFMFSSNLSVLPYGKMREEKLTHRFL